MISPKKFVSLLASYGYETFTGVPCSYFKDIINYLGAHAQNYFIAPNEGAALALASGMSLAGKGSVVMIQNSGLGNLINPLTSLNMIYKIPVLLFVSGRAYGIPDEPQHEIMGAKMQDLLKSLGVSYRDLPTSEDAFVKALSEAIEVMSQNQRPFVFLVHRNTFEVYDYHISAQAPQYPLKRIDAIRILSSVIPSADLVFATTGMISRELFAVDDCARNFYMQGSMGHIASLAMGTSLAQPERKVIALDGDGAFLMHMGTSSMVGFYKPKNFIHIVLDNESYETTGDQDTTATTTDFLLVAKACAYKNIAEARDEDSLRQSLQQLLGMPGPSFLRIKINRLSSEGTPRITTKYSADQIAKNFKDFLNSQNILK